ncbi:MULTISPECIES: phosphate ABC transporter permease subunit PstC [unclassified Candidatus Frackibacter]|uniref:phosphate ABC transporter permease subunit PstC n=1 Tax=unclassified Candidatus Frackibacter TaxID=2648818 RepID=UPI00079C3508|nr:MULTISPECIES: phosphate ABC transporter permease subunit PstC [unclassified Candidatus Frackibacter]KXS40264.1 MAG: phosphate ABC transporter, permease protein PstC [Candidatus Frackibacter sp. T328-2]SDB96681.1 phosphate ABC transporter membrane protein 1, PhoT family [Candidatus Frackibacter sp. WG11]SEM28169.1 phosphate ABC transporter membrane protein 1, PhoT family [Candidatus Frackibacter sp. WG12]SFL33047.1 phosphate ABC transporter membrane protein 1, PhoT family [Candidatus Frackiba
MLNSQDKSLLYAKEEIIKWILRFFASVSILTTLGIIIILFKETFAFFNEVSIIEFFTSATWAPMIKPRSFGILPLVVGTLMIAVGSSIISIPIGLGSAIYLSEYASKEWSKVIKPILEILAGIPSVVYGFFALTFITPLIQKILPQTGVFNAASASIAVGIMIIPMVASLSEDAMRSVPDSIRHGAYALGATKFQVVVKTVIPAAFSGIISSFILGISRAIGETMIVAIAAGASSELNLNPLQSIQTMTGFMVNASLGETPRGTIEYKTLFVVGALLFVMTLIMNLFAKLIVQAHEEGY